MRLVRGNLLWVVVLVVAIMAGFSQRLTVHTTMPAANVWDILVPVQADLYLAAYLFLPAWIFRLGVELPIRADETWLLRYGSRLRWLLRTGSWALGQAAMLLLVWLLACAIVAAGLPWATSWSHIADPDGNDVLLAALQGSGLGPLSSWALQWVAYLALLLTIFILLALTTLLTAKPWQRYLVAAAAYVVMVIAIRGGLPVGHLMFSYQAAATGTPAWLPIAAPQVAITLIVVGFAGFEKARRATTLSAQLEHLGPQVAYLSVVIAGMATTAINLGADLNLPDLLLSAFYGFDRSQLNLGVYSYFLLTFAGFSLMHLVSAEQRLWPLYQLVSIRSGSPRRWMAYGWRDLAVKAGAFMLALALVAAVIVALSRHPLSGPATGLVLYQFLVNGSLQLIATTGITVLVAYLSRSRGVVLTTIAAIAIIQTPLVNIGQVLPLGLNALGLADDWPTVLGFSGYLGVTGMSVLGLSLAACSHRFRQTLERTAA